MRRFINSTQKKHIIIALFPRFCSSNIGDDFWIKWSEAYAKQKEIERQQILNQQEKWVTFYNETPQIKDPLDRLIDQALKKKNASDRQEKDREFDEEYDKEQKAKADEIKRIYDENPENFDVNFEKYLEESRQKIREEKRKNLDERNKKTKDFDEKMKKFDEETKKASEKFNAEMKKMNEKSDEETKKYCEKTDEKSNKLDEKLISEALQKKKDIEWNEEYKDIYQKIKKEETEEAKKLRQVYEKDPVNYQENLNKYLEECRLKVEQKKILYKKIDYYSYYYSMILVFLVIFIIVILVGIKQDYEKKRWKK